VSPRAQARTQACSVDDARARLAHATKFLEVAELVANEEDAAYRSVATSLAVLAGIAASDAACCAALGRRSRGQDHGEAAVLLDQVRPGGPQAASALRRLLALKEAQYGLADVAGKDMCTAIRQAAALIDKGAKAIERT
jgi:hypothetical protein